MGFMAPEKTTREESPNVKMKMNEEEGPVERNDTRESGKELNSSP